MVSPSALAVLRLITSSNLVGCSMGRSPGLVPLRILSDRSPPCLEGDVLPLHVPQLAEPVAQRLPPGLARGIGAAEVKESDPHHLPLRLCSHDGREDEQGQGQNRHAGKVQVVMPTSRSR
jgi:hypothetical protein